MRMKRCWLILPVLLIASCMLKGKQTSTEQLSSYDKDAEMSYYFPGIRKQTARDSALLFQKSRLLSLFDEKALSEYVLNNPVIRFIYLRSFNDFLIVRIDNKQIVIKQANQHQPGFYFRNDTTLLTAEELHALSIYNAYQMLDGAHHPDTAKFLTTYPWLRNNDYRIMLLDKMEVPGADSIIYTTSTIEIGPGIIRELTEHVDRSGYWQMPISRHRGGGLDGANWDLEVAVNGKHHLVHDWSPDAGAFYDLCKHILKYTQLKEHEIY